MVKKQLIVLFSLSRILAEVVLPSVDVVRNSRTARRIFTKYIMGLMLFEANRRSYVFIPYD